MPNVPLRIAIIRANGILLVVSGSCPPTAQMTRPAAVNELRQLAFSGCHPDVFVEVLAGASPHAARPSRWKGVVRLLAMNEQMQGGFIDSPESNSPVRSQRIGEPVFFPNLRDRSLAACHRLRYPRASTQRLPRSSPEIPRTLLDSKPSCIVYVAKRPW